MLPILRSAALELCLSFAPLLAALLGKSCPASAQLPSPWAQLRLPFADPCPREAGEDRHAGGLP
jgi:hypothetical protein